MKKRAGRSVSLACLNPHEPHEPLALRPARLSRRIQSKGKLKMTRKLTDDERESNAGKQARKARSRATERALKILDPHFVVDKAESPVQLISAGNTVAGSFTESFSSINQSANVIEIQFANEENDYERETIQIENEVAIVAGDPIRKRTMFLEGVTRLTQAERVGRYLLNLFGSGDYRTYR